MNLKNYDRDLLAAVESTDKKFAGSPLIVDAEGAYGHLRFDEARSMMFRGCNSYNRLPTLIEMASQMDCADWLTLLGEIWEVCDNITLHVEDLLDKTPFANLARSPEKWRDRMMTADERAVLETLPPRVTIYRGCFEHNKDGLSWSLNRQTAAGFPFLNGYRSKGQPLLITATALRKQVLAFKNDRDEEEVIALWPEIQAIENLRPLND